MECWLCFSFVLVGRSTAEYGVTWLRFDLLSVGGHIIREFLQLYFTFKLADVLVFEHINSLVYGVGVKTQNVAQEHDLQLIPPHMIPYDRIQ